MVRRSVRNRWRWIAAIAWVAVTTPLAYRMSVGELRPAAQYAAAQQRIASLHWDEGMPAVRGALSPDAYLLAYASERERYNDRHLLQLRFSAATAAAIAGGSLPFLLLVFFYRRRPSPTLSV